MQIWVFTRRMCSDTPPILSYGKYQRCALLMLPFLLGTYVKIICLSTCTPVESKAGTQRIVRAVVEIKRPDPSRAFLQTTNAHSIRFDCNYLQLCSSGAKIIYIWYNVLGK